MWRRVSEKEGEASSNATAAIARNLVFCMFGLMANMTSVQTSVISEACQSFPPIAVSFYK